MVAWNMISCLSDVSVALYYVRLLDIFRRKRARRTLLPPLSALHRMLSRRAFSTSAYRAMSTNASLRNTFATPEQLAQLESSGWRVIDSAPAPASASASAAGDDDGAQAATEAEGYPAQGLPTQRRLAREFNFGTFSRAWGFMSRVALAAEKLNVSPVCVLSVSTPIVKHADELSRVRRPPSPSPGVASP